MKLIRINECIKTGDKRILLDKDNITKIEIKEAIINLLLEAIGIESDKELKEMFGNGEKETKLFNLNNMYGVEGSKHNNFGFGGDKIFMLEKGVK